LAESDEGYVIKNFAETTDQFRLLEKWKIAGQNAAWKNVKTGKVVFDGNFFTSITGSSMPRKHKNEAQAQVVAVLNNQNLTNEQLRELTIFLISSGIVYVGNDPDVCWHSEIKTNTTYQADFFILDREYTNRLVVIRHDLSIVVDRTTGEIEATTIYRESLIRDNIDLFGWERYRPSPY
jgi:hypothetical protein